MSCEECKRGEKLARNYYYSLAHKIYYRWKAARIVIIACPQHGKEIIKALNENQRR